MNYGSRRNKIREFLYITNVDAFITNYRPNFMYLSGFTGSTAFLIITKQEDYLVVDGRYVLRAKNETDKNINIVDCLDKLSLINKTIEKLISLKIRSIALENIIAVDYYLYFSKEFEVKVFNNLVHFIRSQKEEEEIEKIKQALKISEKVLSEAQEKLFNGVDKITEIDLANFIKNRIFELGGTGIAFEPIVAFGKNTALPHYSPSKVILREGDFVIIDMGAVLDYYHSDITRSFCIGKNKEFEKLYNIVLEAQEIGIQSIKEEYPTNFPYNKVVEFFDKYGLKEKFVHGLGHGVGLEIHELPSMSVNSSGFLKNKNVITVEPGIYIEEVGGIRIEDMVLIQDEKPVVLTTYPK